MLQASALRLTNRLAIATAIAAFAATFASQPMHAAPITGIVYIQPIHVCTVKVSGTTCGASSDSYYEAETEAIWAQAGLQISFLNWETFSYTDSNGLSILSPTNDDYGTFVYEQIGPQEINGVPVISMWFAPTISQCGSASASGGTIWGCTVTGYFSSSLDIFSDIFISDLIFGAKRIDTVGHELGHSLGLGHCGSKLLDSTECGSSGYASYLMADGNTRTIPTSISNITAGLRDKLTLTEISVADSSGFVFHTPEPASFALAAIGGLFLLRRRRSS
jgi:MYXO-CTERM domain-containing protein